MLLLQHAPYIEYCCQDFQQDADKVVTFVKRKLGDDLLSVELTKKQIWACFEEATMEYGTLINEYQTKSQLSNLLGITTGSNVEGKYAHETLDFILRLAEPYAQEGGFGGSYNTLSGSITLEDGRQDYDMYSAEIFMMSNVKCIYEEFNGTLYCLSNYGTSLAFFPEENYFAMSNLFIDTNYEDSILVSYGYCREK